MDLRDPSSGELTEFVPSDARLRWRTLTQRLRVLHSSDDVQDFLFEVRNTLNRPAIWAFLNSHALNSVVADEKFYQALLGCNVIFRDGIGVAIHLFLKNEPVGLNLNGTDLIPQILTAFNGRKIALLGTKEPYLGLAIENIHSALAPGSEIVCEHGFHDLQKYIEFVSLHNPDLIVLGMGMPKQEIVAMALRDSMNYGCLIVCGGAIIDFLGGRVSRAPILFRMLHIEWAYRLALEPRRLFRRYVIGNPVFLVRSLKYLYQDKFRPSSNLS